MVSAHSVILTFALGFAPPVWNMSQTAHDERLLGLNASAGPTVIERFRENMLTPAETADVRKLIEQLGSLDYREREAALAELKFWRSGAEALLVQHEHDANLERRRRVRQILEKGLGRWSNLQAEAAARLLRKSPSPEAVRVLLDYFPYADDPGVRCEIVATLRDFAGQSKDFAAALRSPPLDDEAPGERSPTLLALDRARSFFAHVAQNDIDKLTAITRLPFSLGNGVILTSPDQRDDFFKQAITNYREANRNATLTFLHVTRVEEHLRFADEPERSFLLAFPAAEVRVVHVRVRRDWQNEETGALLVHIGPRGQAIVGLGKTGMRSVRGK